jgi:hypothetical protein
VIKFVSGYNNNPNTQLFQAEKNAVRHHVPTSYKMTKSNLINDYQATTTDIKNIEITTLKANALPTELKEISAKSTSRGDI